MIVLRKLGRTETSASVAFTFTLSCTLISGFALPFVWISPDILDLAGLIAVGLLGGVGQILMTTAFKHGDVAVVARSEEHTSELQSLMRTSYAVFCLKKNTTHTQPSQQHT